MTRLLSRPGSGPKYFGNLMTPPQQVTIVTLDLDIAPGIGHRFKMIWREN